MACGPRPTGRSSAARNWPWATTRQLRSQMLRLVLHHHRPSFRPPRTAILSRRSVCRPTLRGLSFALNRRRLRSDHPSRARFVPVERYCSSDESPRKPGHHHESIHPTSWPALRPCRLSWLAAACRAQDLYAPRAVPGACHQPFARSTDTSRFTPGARSCFRPHPDRLLAGLTPRPAPG